ncbi:flagellar biosynthesis protein FlhF [Candidatus Arthromitus sp. SFB-turkey]|uniref:flagellar biosynthesis protein FlhF n=1 Tax=Candidatus Arthromitus sp. SFB-turkey TaxID=1840217 RepID=UPI0007F3E90E|nr:flagellar biosynthesis protein FlhF [Candidatus Arthromitus sp. SFB-turkey]OAT88968.1 flagellar biosynthesis protein FlhF [Candidatus Arthromitus sp. SFB-turkey]
MIIRKYLVDNINEALFRIKHELGDDAYIISQKMVREPGVKGFFSNKKLEVTVGLINKENLSENKYLPNEEVQGGVLSSSVNQPQADLNNSILSNNDVKQQFLGSYAQNSYSQNDKSKSMSYYNKLFEEKQKMFNNFNNESFNQNYQDLSKEAIPNQNNFQIENLRREGQNRNSSSIIDLNLDQFSNRLVNKYPDDLNENLNYVNQVDKFNILKPEIQNENSQELKKELQEIKDIVKGLVNNNSASPLNCLDEILHKHDICKELCEEIKSNCTLTSEELRNEKIVKKYLRDVFSNIIKIYENDVSNKFVVVGPTGSGKTTTVAKLAGMLSLNLNKRVGMVTIDTFRVGAVEQLKMYADIMNIPYKSVMTLNDIRSVFDDMKACDVILVDTIGRGNKNIIQLNELSMFVQSIQSNDVSLVVSAGMKEQDVDLFINSFKGIKFTNVIVTKLDETNSFGMLVNICYKTSIPISFLTIGQDVPLDIKKANKNEILDMILGEEEL